MSAFPSESLKNLAFLRLAAVALCGYLALIAAPVQGADFCDRALSLKTNTVQEVDEGGRGADSFAVDVPSPGILRILAEAADPRLERPTIELAGKDCGPVRAQDLTYVTRSLTAPVFKIAVPGRYGLRVRSTPELRWRTYRLRTEFVAATPVVRLTDLPKSIDDWEEDEDTLVAGVPVPIGARSFGGTSKSIDDWEEDDESKSIDDWEEDDESLAADRSGRCTSPPSTAGEERITVLVRGILAVDAGSDLLGVLSPSSPAATGLPLGPSRELLVTVEAGDYTLRWSAARALECGPRLRFYPTGDPPAS